MTPDEAGMAAAGVGLAKGILIVVIFAVLVGGYLCSKLILAWISRTKSPTKAILQTVSEARPNAPPPQIDALASSASVVRHNRLVEHSQGVDKLYSDSQTQNSITPSAPNGIEDDAYELVALELENNTPNKGLWTRAFAQCDGDERATKVLYIKLRVEQILVAEQAKRNAENQQIESAKIIRDREHFSRMDARSQMLCLISSGARVAIPDDSDVFLHLLRKGDESQLGEFLERDVRYLAATEIGTGNSPLHIAIVESNPQIAKLLIEWGASVGVKNNFGLTPLDFAKSKVAMQEVAEIIAEVQQFRSNAGAQEN